MASTENTAKPFTEYLTADWGYNEDTGELTIGNKTYPMVNLIPKV
jgi:hypothetical protein